MRLYEVGLGENPIIDVDKLKQLCAPIIEVMKSVPDHEFYRGYGGTRFDYLEGFKTIEPRMDRRSLSNPPELHIELNKFFSKKFGFPYRNGVFVTSNKSEAKWYSSTVYVVLPVGELEYVWSPEHRDLFTSLENKNMLHEFPPAVIQKIEDDFRQFDIEYALQYNYEVMFKNKCIVLSVDEYESIKSELLK